MNGQAAVPGRRAVIPDPPRNTPCQQRPQQCRAFLPPGARRERAGPRCVPSHPSSGCWPRAHDTRLTPCAQQVLGGPAAPQGHFCPRSQRLAKARGGAGLRAAPAAGRARLRGARIAGTPLPAPDPGPASVQRKSSRDGAPPQRAAPPSPGRGPGLALRTRGCVRHVVFSPGGPAFQGDQGARCRRGWP